MSTQIQSNGGSGYVGSKDESSLACDDTGSWVPDVDPYAELPRRGLKWSADARSAMLAISDLTVALRLLTLPAGPFGRARDDIRDAASYLDRAGRVRS